MSENQKNNLVINSDELEEYRDSILNKISDQYKVTENQLLAMQMIASAYKTILKALNVAYGLDPNDPNFYETPERVAKMMILERCKGINSKEKCLQLLSKTFPPMNNLENDQMVIVANPAVVYSICPHHFENVEYKVWMGYMPNGRFCGLSKFSRVIELYASQPILQESYTAGLADIVMEALNPLGVMVVVKGKHDCMIARGARSNKDQWITTSALRGIFAEPNMHPYKDEFLKICNEL